jgi:hypothetical protein
MSTRGRLVTEEANAGASPGALLEFHTLQLDHSESTLNLRSKISRKQEREMQRARRCITCQDLIDDEPHSFEVSIEDVNRSSARCSICFLLSQASGIYQSIRKLPVQKIQIVTSKSEHGPLLILRWDDSGDRGTYQFLRLFYTIRGLKAISNSILV